MPADSRGRQESCLYLTNLSRAATLANVRQLFSGAGQVLKVEFAPERGHSSTSSAYVTMATPTEAERAIQKFHGRLFQDRSVMVSLLSNRSEEKPPEPPRAPTKACIAQQYREREGMVYELDCSGARLTLRFFFHDDHGTPYRVAGSTTQGKPFVAEGAGATRELALAALTERWGEAVESQLAPELNWTEVVSALRAVRAVSA